MSRSVFFYCLTVSGLLVGISYACRSHLSHHLVKTQENDPPSATENNQVDRISLPEGGEQVMYLVKPLEHPEKVNIKALAGMGYHTSSERIGRHLIPLISMKSATPEDLKRISLVDYSELVVCTTAQDEESCGAQRNRPLVFSGSSYMHLSLTGEIREILVRACLRGGHTDSGLDSCTAWQHLPLPSDFQNPHRDDHPEADRLLSEIHREKVSVRQACQKLGSIYQEFLDSGPEPEENYAILAKNGLILGEDHCVNLVESRFLWDFNTYTRLTQKAWKSREEVSGKDKSGKGEEVSEEGEEKVLGVIPENLLEIAMLSMAGLSIVEVAGSKIGFVQRNAARLEARFKSQVRVTMAALMLMEIGLSAIEIVDTFQKDDKPFPLVSTLVISYTSLELMMSVREWKEEARELALEKISKLREGTQHLTEFRGAKGPGGFHEDLKQRSILASLSTNVTLKENFLQSVELPPKNLIKAEGEEVAEAARKSGFVEGFSEVFSKVSKGVGFVIAGLEIANILSRGGVDKAAANSMTLSGSQDQALSDLKVKLDKMAQEFRSIGAAMSKSEKTLAFYQEQDSDSNL